MSLPFKSSLRSAIRLLVFSVALLLGIQVPAFVDQYSQRVDAHYQEVSLNISGFQQTAALLFGGDMAALVEYYRSSSDPVFRSDANSVQFILTRYQRIAAEQAALQGNGLAVAWHVVVAADQELFNEALTQYSYTVPLNALALQWGFALAISIMLLIELAMSGCVHCVRALRRRRPGVPV
jgi:hypothetical protein